MGARFRIPSVPVRFSLPVRLAVAAGLAALAACTLAPAGTDEEFRRSEEAGAAWSAPPAERRLPELPAAPTADDIVARALLAHGGLEAAWHAWRAALHRVLVASGWPNTDLAVGLTSLLENGSLWDTSTVTLGFDPMQMLLLPHKVRVAGEEAFGEALAAGRAFEAARVELRERALLAWWDWVLLGERLAVQERRVALADSLSASASAAMAVGASQRGLLQAHVDAGMERVALDELRAQLPAQRAALNALLAREPDAPLEPPAPGAHAAPRPLPADADILAAGLAANPELAGLAALSAAREAALELAAQRREPNLAPSASASGGGAESLGVMVTLPVTVPAVEAAVDAARADLAGARAREAQAGRDTAAALLATLATLRNDERRLERLEQEILPGARALLDNARTAYVSGQADLAAWVEAQQAVLDVDLARAEARAERERNHARLERLAGCELRELPPDTATDPPLAAGDVP